MGWYLRGDQQHHLPQARGSMSGSPPLIGSGMVFDFDGRWEIPHALVMRQFLLRTKELEIYLATENIFVDYEARDISCTTKTSRQEVMARQRSRWFHAQLLVTLDHTRDLIRTLNWNYMDKAILNGSRSREY